MALKKEIKPWLKENGLTWEQMNAFWDELCQPYGDNKYLCPKAGLVSRCGKSWDSLCMSEIAKLPTLKEYLIKQIEDTEKLKDKEAEDARKKAEADKYYSEHFEEIMVEKIDNGEELTEREIKDCLDYELEEYREDGGSGSWTRYIKSIVNMCDRYFAINWQSGLTEYQENIYDNQPYEVTKHEYEKTITVTDWIKKEK